MKRFIRRSKVIRFFSWGNKGHKHLGPDVEKGKFKVADFILIAATIILVNVDKFDWLPDFPYKMEVLFALGILLILVSFYSYFHKLCPMSRWGRASWATGMMAAMWAIIPLLVYAIGESDDWQTMCYYSAWSSVMWVTFLFCLYKFWRVKRRTRAVVAMIEWRIRNKKRGY